MGGDPENVHGTGAHLHHEERVEAGGPDGIDVKEIGGQQPTGLGLKEHAPLSISPGSSRSRSSSTNPERSTRGQAQ